MTYRVIYGKTRDTMTSEMDYERLSSAKAAYYATEFNRWCALMDGDKVTLTNVDTGPIVEPRCEEGCQK